MARIIYKEVVLVLVLVFLYYDIHQPIWMKISSLRSVSVKFSHLPKGDAKWMAEVKFLYNSEYWCSVCTYKVEFKSSRTL